MQQCSAFIFNSKMELMHHCFIEQPTIDFDYLAPNNNEILVPKFEYTEGNGFIRITGAHNFDGIIKTISDEDTDETKIVFKPLLSLFSQQVLINTNWQGTMSLENVLKKTISDYWVTNSDSLQNLPNVTITTSGSTMWGFNLKSDTEDEHHCIVNFYDVMLQNALIKYGIVVKIVPNYMTKSFSISIKKETSSPRFIKADHESIKIVEFEYHNLSDVVNKLEIWNSEGYSQFITYYLHPNGSYSRTNSDRITPVIQHVTAVKKQTAEEDGEEVVTKTFEQAASEAASNEFSGVEYKDCIELEVPPDSIMVKPVSLEIGQLVDIRRGNKEYRSMLTGKIIGSDAITLRFGTIRYEATKKGML